MVCLEATRLGPRGGVRGLAAGLRRSRAQVGEAQGAQGRDRSALGRDRQHRSGHPGKFPPNHSPTPTTT